MSPFTWRILLVVALVFFAFIVATLTMNLILVRETHRNDVNMSVLTYVEIANWTFVGLLGLMFMAAFLTAPKIFSYSEKTESLVSTGLRKARQIGT